MPQKIDFEILNRIAANGPLLTEVEAFLDLVGEAELSAKLLQLENDVGVQLFEDIGDPSTADVPAEADLKNTAAFLEDANPEFMVRTAELHAQRQPLTYDRLTVLEQVQTLLDSMGPLQTGLDHKMRVFRDSLAPPASLQPAGVKPSGMSGPQ